MRTLFSRAIQIDPSFHVALGVLVIFAVAEVFFATSYYVGRARANRVVGTASYADDRACPCDFGGFSVSASGGAAKRFAADGSELTRSIRR